MSLGEDRNVRSMCSKESCARDECGDRSSIHSNSTTQALSKASSSDLRSRFLHHLGFQIPPATKKQCRNVPSLIERHKVAVVHEALKGDYGEKDRHLEHKKKCRSSAGICHPSTKSADRGHTPCVSFDVSVEVHPIAKRSEYSQRMHETLWTPKQEIQQHMLRNCIEYEAEGWDWQRVCDDDEMVPYNGQMVHPVHFAAVKDHNCNLNSQFCAIRAIQMQQN